jgi:hypothetical protein
VGGERLYQAKPSKVSLVARHLGACSFAILAACALIIVEFALVSWFSASNFTKPRAENPNGYAIPLEAILQGLVIMVLAISGPVFVIASAIIQVAKRSASWGARRNLLVIAAAIALGANAFVLSDGLSDMKLIATRLSLLILPAIAMAYVFGIFTGQVVLKKIQNAANP